MKHNIMLLLAGLALIATGCNPNTYSDLRKQEDKLIANYISRNGLVIVEEEPAADHVWGEKEYYKVKGEDNFYFHLIERGDSIRIDSVSPDRSDTVDLKIISNDLIVVRYKQFALTENADYTVSTDFMSWGKGHSSNPFCHLIHAYKAARIFSAHDIARANWLRP